MVIAFDIDDTLIIPTPALPLIEGTCGAKFLSGVPNYPVVDVYRFFKAQGHTMVIWSGGGKEWAKQWADKLGLEPDFIGDKLPDARFGKPDICFDDCIVDLATVNVRVKRVNNQISRKEWNEHKPTPDLKEKGDGE